MEIIKKISLCGLAWSILLISCDYQGGLKDDTNKVFINFEKPSISEDLKNISQGFIDTFQINNSIIEVTIDKKEAGTYIILKCRGLYYFEVMELRPSFTYELNNNSFFVFIGAENLFDSTFDENKFQNRRKEKCEDSFMKCYWFKDGKMIDDEECTYPYPFTDIQMVPPQPINKKDM